MANAFKNYPAKNITTAPSTLLTATTETVILGLWVANTTGAQILIDVWVTISAVDYYLVKSAPIPTGGALLPIGAGAKVVLESGDAIKAQSDTANSADAMLNVLEIT
jgi:hypothetical protein